MASSNQAAGTRTQARNNTQAIVVTAMCIALTYIFTAVVNIRLPFAPNGGLIHLGNVPLFLAAIIFGRKTGALSGAFGMGLFDLFSGWIEVRESSIKLKNGWSMLADKMNGCPIWSDEEE